VKQAFASCQASWQGGPDGDGPHHHPAAQMKGPVQNQPGTSFFSAYFKGNTFPGRHF
jgi:hypothetical protein